MRKITRYSGFTLIELMVAITIFGVITVSVVSIFMLSSQTSQKIEAARVLQQNVKNVTEDIAENIRQNSIKDVSPGLSLDCSQFTGGSKQGDKLCVESYIYAGHSEYLLARENSGTWTRVSDTSVCEVIATNIPDLRQNPCRVVKRENGVTFPLTNNRVHVERLSFELSSIILPQNKIHPRVTFSMTLYPSFDQGLRFEAINASQMKVQTSMSERIILHN